jgi:hypothetical protein
MLGVMSGSEYVVTCCTQDGAMYVRLVHDSRDPNYKKAMPVRFVEEEDNWWMNITEDRRPLRWTIGEQDKFLNQSDKCLARIMRALIKTHSKMLDSFAFGKDNTDAFVATVEIPQGKEKEFEKLASAILVRPTTAKIN